MQSSDDRRYLENKMVVDQQTGLPEMNAHVRPLVESDIAQAQSLVQSVVQGKDRAWLEASIPLIMASPNGRIFGAFSSGDANRLIAVGSVTESMHDFSHVGLGLIAVEPELVSTSEVRALVGCMVAEAESRHPLPQDQELSGLSSNDTISRRFFVSSVGTVHPQLFEEYGFHSVHKHQQHDGSGLHWMMKVSPERLIEFFSQGYSQFSVYPRMTEGLKIVEDEVLLGRAAEIVRQQWGQDSAEAFLSEWYEIQRMPGSALYVLEENGNIASVGSIIKAHHHPGAWSRAWIVTDKAYRGRGCAERLIQGLLQHAHNLHGNFTDGPLFMEGSTFVPNYYVKFGNAPVARCTNPTSDGKHATWTMRITPPASQMTSL